MKLIPAGISKKKGHKPYAAFWVCDKKEDGCGFSRTADGPHAMPAPAAAERTMADVVDQLNRIEDKLDRALAAFIPE